MIRLETHDDGVVLPVRAKPGAGRNGIAGEHNGALKVSVTQAAEKGKANKALVAVLAKELRLRKSQIELIAGRTSSQKRFLVREITIDDLARRIEKTL